MSIREARNLHYTGRDLKKIAFPGCREHGAYSGYPVKPQKPAGIKGAEDMKYILLMAAPKAGFDTYRAWSEKDVQAHFAVLKSINKELSESGGFVATEGLAWPDQAKVVQAGKDGAPVTDGVFPESKEFLPATGSSTSRVQNALMKSPPGYLGRPVLTGDR
jgi:hypothetical protein